MGDDAGLDEPTRWMVLVDLLIAALIIVGIDAIVVHLARQPRGVRPGEM